MHIRFYWLVTIIPRAITKGPSFVGIGGPEWGTEQGHFWIDYGTLLFPELVHAFFMIKATCSDDKGLCVSKADCMSVYEPQVCTSTNIKE